MAITSRHNSNTSSFNCLEEDTEGVKWEGQVGGVFWKRVGGGGRSLLIAREKSCLVCCVLQSPKAFAQAVNVVKLVHSRRYTVTECN